MLPVVNTQNLPAADSHAGVHVACNNIARARNATACRAFDYREAHRWAMFAMAHMNSLFAKQGRMRNSADNAGGGYSSLMKILQAPDPVDAFRCDGWKPRRGQALQPDHAVLLGARYLDENHCPLRYALMIEGDVARTVPNRPSSVFLRIMSDTGDISFFTEPFPRMGVVVSEDRIMRFDEMFEVIADPAPHRDPVAVGGDGRELCKGREVWRVWRPSAPSINFMSYANLDVRVATVAGFDKGKIVFGVDIHHDPAQPDWLRLIFQPVAAMPSMLPKQALPADYEAASSLLCKGTSASLPDWAGVITGAIAVRQIGATAMALLKASESPSPYCARRGGFTTSRQVLAALDKFRRLHDGVSSNRIAELMARDDEEGSLPMTRYMQLLSALCTEGLLHPGDAIDSLRYDSVCCNANCIGPVAVIACRWNNPAAPVFACAIAAIVKALPEYENMARVRIKGLFTDATSDASARQSMWGCRSFCEKIMATRWNACGMHATATLYAARLMEAPVLDKFEKRRKSLLGRRRWKPIGDPAMPTLAQLGMSAR